MSERTPDVMRTYDEAAAITLGRLVRDHRQAALATLDDGAYGMHLVDAILQSSREERWVKVG